VSYPDLYIEEIPSGVCTITGVATSIAAFDGRCCWATRPRTLRERNADIAVLTEHFVPHFRSPYNQLQKYPAPEPLT
jgi:hypothetical protein